MPESAPPLSAPPVDVVSPVEVAPPMEVEPASVVGSEIPEQAVISRVTKEMYRVFIISSFRITWVVGELIGANRLRGSLGDRRPSELDVSQVAGGRSRR